MTSSASYCAEFEETHDNLVLYIHANDATYFIRPGDQRWK